MRQNLEKRLAEILKEMDAEMPIPNPDCAGQSKGKGFDLKFSKELAEKERRIFEERLGDAGKGVNSEW